MVAAVDDPYQKGATRSELTLGRIGQAWSMRGNGRRFVRALSGFLSSGGSRYTERTYAYAVLGFWEWLDSTGRGLPTPDELSRQDAVSYEKWLRESGENLIRYRLASDPAREMDLAIYDFVVANEGSRIDDIRSALLATGRFSYAGRLGVDDSCKGGLHRYLGAMVINKVLRREPTIAELRSIREYRDVILSGDVTKVFRYYPEIGFRTSDDRVCGNATRIGVLGAFWSYMASQGENLPGASEPLIRFNIWEPVLKRVREQAASHQAERRMSKTPEGDLFARVLATTYRSSHGDRALEAAEAAIRGEVIPSSRGKFADLRDRALLLVMLQAGGPRASEVQHMRRADISDDLSTLTIRGKRNKIRTVPVPPAAADAIARMTARIVSVIERRRAQGKNAGRLEELLYAEAPLLPAIRYWGANRGADSSCGLTRAGIAMRLRHLAQEAGLQPGSAEFAQMHPHGVRRLFARQHMAMGTPLNVLQALMGHASGATTLRYAEERSVEALRTAAFGASRPTEERLGVVRGPMAQAAEVAAPEPARRLPEPEEPPQASERPVRQPMAEPKVVKVVREQPRPSRRAVPKLGPPSEACVAISPVGALRTLCEVYEADWGERGNRTRLKYGKGLKELKGSSEAAIAIEMAPVEEVGAELEVFGESKRLEHTYAGRDTGLVWWLGTIGYLRPEMPVASVRQIGEQCGPETRSGLCDALVGLWSDWNDDDSKGPTAAGALGMWVAEFLETSAQLDREITLREGYWVEHSSPIEETVLGGTKREPETRRVFREHDEARIIDWFKEVGWQYRVSVARPKESDLQIKSFRTTKVIDTPLEVPDWYALEDPLAAMSASERDEAIDLVLALTRGVLADRTPRWGAVSRKVASDLIQAMMAYDRSLDDLGELKNRVRMAGATADDEQTKGVAEQKRIVADLGVRATMAFRSLGAPADFDLVKLTVQRARVQKAAVKGRRKRWAFRLDMLRQAFGDGPADDPYVALAARHSDDPPLGSTPARDLLDPDPAAGTIRHRAEYKKQWAKDHGTHSECVARRLARHMYELFVASSGRGPFARRDVLIRYVTSMYSYRVPCPAAMERELRALLRYEDVKIPIYEKWRAAFGTEQKPKPKELPAGATYEPTLAELEEEEEEDRSSEVEAMFAELEGSFNQNPGSLPRSKASSALPHPLLTLMLLLPFIPP